MASETGGWGSKKTGGTPSPFVVQILDAAFEVSVDREGKPVVWNSGSPINLNLEGPIVRVTLDDDGNVDEYGEAYNVPEGYDHPRKSYLLGDTGSWTIEDDGTVSARDKDNSATRAVGELVESMADGFTPESDLALLGDWNDPASWVGLELTVVPTLVKLANGKPRQDKNGRDIYNDIIRSAKFAAKELSKKLQKAIKTLVEDEETLKAAMKVLKASDIDVDDVDADELKAFVKKVI